MKNGLRLMLSRTQIGRAWWLPVFFLLATTTILNAGDYTYTTNSDNTLTITGYTGPGGNVVIPSAIEGRTVTIIGDYAFGGSPCNPNTSLTSVTIPDSVTSIEERAFKYCKGLTSVMIGNSVTSIGGEAFSYCIKLTNVTIPDSVTRMGDAAFSSCHSLTSVTIPNSITSIGGEAFSYCTKLANVTIPDSVTSIGDRAFRDCRSLTAITVDTGNSVYSSVDGVLFNKGQTTLIQYPEGKAGSSYMIPDSVTSIGDYAFYSCTGLTSVIIGNGVTSIGGGAFYDCNSLISVTVGNSVTGIGNGAFYGCHKLTLITVDTGNSVYSSVDGVLFNKSQTTLIQCPKGKAGSYTIPSGVTNIVEEAFGGCHNLMSVTIPDGVTSIGGWTFSGCESLISITIPDSVTSIGAMAFLFCTSLISITIPNGVTSIGDNAFDFCTSLMGVYFMGNAPSIGSGVFSCDDNTTVYYLAGTTGWGTTFGGRPTALWDRNALGPIIKANGAVGGITINYPEPVSITVAMNAGDYAGVPVDWWVIAHAGSYWYYLNRSIQWTQFDGTIANCHTMYQGPLFNLPAMEVLNTTGLPVGSYTFWFAVDYPMDGVLNLGGQILLNSVTVTVQ